MAVNSKADKTHQLKSTGQKKAAYVSLPTPPTGVQAAPPGGAKAVQGPSQAGSKALLFRARKELAPLSDPNEAPFSS